MTAQDNPYVRVYYRIIDDPRFANVYHDDRALATWLRLLIVADGAYPATAAVPRRTHPRGLSALVAAGLVDMVGKDHFRIHGLEAERERRSEHARKAAGRRWENAGAMHEHSVSNARAMHEQSTSNAGAFGPAMHSAPIRSEPIQSAPLRRANGAKAKETDDEELLTRYLNLWAAATEPGRRTMLAAQLQIMGVSDPAAELAGRRAV